jgi:2'-phosphotransferase
MRRSSQILIYLDIQRAIDAGFKFFLSTNGVILSEGDEKGVIAPRFFKRVENANRTAIPGWEGPAAEMHKVLTEDLPIHVEDLDQAGIGGTGVKDAPTSDGASTFPPSERDPAELVEKLQSVELK